MPASSSSIMLVEVEAVSGVTGLSNPAGLAASAGRLSNAQKSKPRLKVSDVGRVRC
jgi:hypothetical protein